MISEIPAKLGQTHSSVLLW